MLFLLTNFGLMLIKNQIKIASSDKYLFIPFPKTNANSCLALASAKASFILVRFDNSINDNIITAKTFVFVRFTTTNICIS